MKIIIRSGHLSWAAGKSSQKFSSKDAGSTFRALVTLANDLKNERPVDRQLLIEFVDEENNSVYTSITGL